MIMTMLKGGRKNTFSYQYHIVISYIYIYKTIGHIEWNRLKVLSTTNQNADTSSDFY